MTDVGGHHLAPFAGEERGQRILTDPETQATMARRQVAPFGQGLDDEDPLPDLAVHQYGETRMPVVPDLSDAIGPRQERRRTQALLRAQRRTKQPRRHAEG